MKSLDLTEQKGQDFDSLETKAIKIMHKVFDGKGEMDDKEKAAVKILAIVAKNRVTMTAREALHFNIATSISDQQQLKKYVDSTFPQISGKC